MKCFTTGPDRTRECSCVGPFKGLTRVRRKELRDGMRRHTAHGRSGRSPECDECDKLPAYYVGTSGRSLGNQSDDGAGDDRPESSGKAAQHDGGNGSNDHSDCKAGGKQSFVSAPDRRVIDRSTFKRLRDKAVIVTAADRRKMAEDLMADRERLENESAARKRNLQSYDVMRTKCKKLAQVGGTSFYFRCVYDALAPGVSFEGGGGKVCFRT